MKKLALILLMLVLSQTVISKEMLDEQSCSGTNNAYDSTFCWAKLLVNSDNELNRSYKLLRNLLSPAEQESLKSAQFSWLDYRDKNCSGKSGNKGTIDLFCATNLNLERVKLFKLYLKNCGNRDCNKEMLFQHF
ncbi:MULTISPECIES: lysozyme inhibitor LprI family protein [Rodentibacter]|uniref:Lysozyme inhibitor LprI-like N-terminal domain-containing protein n=2 Tax=Rodentibacter TaxID=1960084 RepID=A0A1V3JPV2_9PAST|nr:MULTISPECIES: lysozyme inhibitor LprI family protein [Rodentibacter]OOF39662.1 hypothetical protein BKK47_06135 [Rodentibacter mrazii]OOF58668.1 hypothetical protein BKK55_01555 [Rodentibacter genomosp. 2]